MVTYKIQPWRWSIVYKTIHFNVLVFGSLMTKWCVWHKMPCFYQMILRSSWLFICLEWLKSSSHCRTPISIYYNLEVSTLYFYDLVAQVTSFATNKAIYNLYVLSRSIQKQILHLHYKSSIPKKTHSIQNYTYTCRKIWEQIKAAASLCKASL